MTPTRWSSRRSGHRLGALLYRQRRILGRGRRPFRDRFPLPHLRGGHKGRRHHHQRPRHRRLQHPTSSPRTIRQLIERVPNSDKVVWSVHCHNDLGLAVANSWGRPWSAPARSNAPSTAWANGPATPPRGNRHGGAHRADASSRSRPASTRPRSSRHQDRLPDHRLPGAAQQGHRRRQRLRPRIGHPPGRRPETPRKPTRSCAPGCRLEPEQAGGKHSGRNAFKTRLQELGIEVDSDEVLNAGLRPLQGTGRQEARNFRRGSARPGFRRGRHARPGEKLIYSHVCSETGEMPHAQVVLSVGGSEKQGRGRRRRAGGCHLQAIETIAGSGAELLSIRSTPSPPAPTPRAK